MSIAEMKLELIRKIDNLSEGQLKDVKSFFDYQFSDDNDDGWNEPVSLSEIDESIKELDEGKSIPIEEVMSGIRKKYNLNG